MAYVMFLLLFKRWLPKPSRIFKRVYGCFLDHFNVYGNMSDHIDHLKKHMEKCQINAISFNPYKCAFYVNLKVLLSHIVCQEDPRKLATILNMLPPTSFIKIKNFLGVARFYWRYFKIFTNKVAPMGESMVK